MAQELLDYNKALHRIGGDADAFKKNGGEVSKTLVITTRVSRFLNTPIATSSPVL